MQKKKESVDLTFHCLPILKPLADGEFHDNELMIINNNKIKIQEHLNIMKYGQEITFDEFLSKLSISLIDYILALRSSIKRPTIFLKRKPNDKQTWISAHS